MANIISAEQIANLLRGYSNALSADTKKLIETQALLPVIKSFIMPDVDLSLAAQPTRGPETIVPGMRRHDQIWCAIVDACKADLNEGDYLYLRDCFKSRMVTCDPQAWQVAFPDYRPQG